MRSMIRKSEVGGQISDHDWRSLSVVVADLVDLLMPFTHPSGLPSMSRLASPFHSR